MSIADDVFAAADAVEFAIHGDAATYRPKDGASVSVTLIRSRADRLDGTTLVDTEVAEIRVAALAAAAEGDLIELGDLRFHVASVARDDLRLVWRLGLRETS